MTEPGPVYEIVPPSEAERRERPDFAAHWPTVPVALASAVYDLACQGVTDREIAQQFRIPLGRFTLELGRITMRAREQYPTHTVERAMLMHQGRALPERLGGGAPLPLDAIAKIRELAGKGMPDKFIAIGASVKPEVLNEPSVRQMIEEERLRMTERLLANVIRAAVGNESLLEAIATELQDARMRGDPIEEKTVENILQLLSSERVAPNLALAERLLTRLGYFEAPLQAELKVRVVFDQLPERAPELNPADEVEGDAKVQKWTPPDDVDS